MYYLSPIVVRLVSSTSIVLDMAVAVIFISLVTVTYISVGLIYLTSDLSV